jgi:hypothetical protein
MSSGTSTVSLGEAARAVGDLVGQGTKIGLGLLDSIKLPLPTRSCGCDCTIPPPCWEPQPIGDEKTRACPGNKAVLRLHVTNCGSQARTIEVDTTDKAVTVSPASVEVGPYEEATVVLTLDVPAGATEGESQTRVVWVRGCHVHYLRWTVEVTCGNASCCSDVDVSDCPDLVHHWYDHFYCDRPCPNQR